jgi:hypothetical protein
MEREVNDNELIAAYHAGRLTPEECAEFEARLLVDDALASEVESLGQVASWLQRSIDAGPSANFRLSADRTAAIRAAASDGIVEFPAARVRSDRTRSGFVRGLRRYGLAAAAALAMIAGGVTGFESGRWQFSDTSAPMLVAVDPGVVGGERDFAAVHSYAPAYGLDHADFSAMASRDRQFRREAIDFAGYTVQPTGDFGLPGPGSPYLRSREILFLQ